MDVEHSIHVAQALVNNHIELETHAPEMVHVAAGEPFRLRFSYRVEEPHARLGACRFAMHLQLDGEPRHAEHLHADHRVAENFVDHVHDDVVLTRRGLHRIHYTVEAERQEHTPLGPLSAVDRMAAEGDIDIMVT